MVSRVINGEVFMLSLVMVAAVLGGLQGVAKEGPATRPVVEEVKVEGMKADSPEGVYLAFYNAVRMGKEEEALKYARPVKPEVRAFAVGLMKYNSAFERLKVAIADKYGPPPRSLALGMMPVEVVKTLKSKIDGNEAKMTVRWLGGREYDVAGIHARRENGEWKVSALDVQPLGMGGPTEEEIAAVPDAGEGLKEQGNAMLAIVPVVDGITADVMAKKFANIAEIEAAIQKAMSGEK